MKENIALDKNFPLDVYDVELGRRKGGKDFYHWHDCFEITLIRSGAAVYYVRKNEYEVRAGDIVVFNKAEPHSWEISGNENLRATVLIFNSSLVTDSANAFDYEYLVPFTGCSVNFRNKLPGSEVSTARIGSLIDEIQSEFRLKSKGHLLMIKSLVLQILTIMVRCHADTENVPEPLEERKRKLGRIDDAITYIKDHFTEDLSLPEVADIASMSSNYFSGYFREATGFSFVEYISRLRVFRASELIRKSDRTTLDIAGECGFNNISNFYRTYKKIFGESPGRAHKAADRG